MYYNISIVKIKNNFNNFFYIILNTWPDIVFSWIVTTKDNLKDKKNYRNVVSYTNKNTILCWYILRMRRGGEEWKKCVN